jgi:hypothetical protein
MKKHISNYFNIYMTIFNVLAFEPTIKMRILLSLFTMQIRIKL